MPRRIRYNVATSLDGFIAPPDESTDWIVQDSQVDFVKLYQEFDTFVMGRKTYETMQKFAMDEDPDQALLFRRGRPKESIIVISRHLDPADHPDVTILRDLGDCIEHLRGLKGQQSQTGGSRVGKDNQKDIWVMGGGWLAAACLEAGLLDTVEAAIMPVVLGGGFKMLGFPFLSGGDGDGGGGSEEVRSDNRKGNGNAYRLALVGLERLPESGIIVTRYDVASEEELRKSQQD